MQMLLVYEVQSVRKKKWKFLPLALRALFSLRDLVVSEESECVVVNYFLVLFYHKIPDVLPRTSPMQRTLCFLGLTESKAKRS